MPYAHRAGCRLHYRWSGDPHRPPLVMIRGLSRSSRFWGPLLPPLQRHLRLLLVDNRGVGRSDAPWPPYSTAGMADDIAAVMDHAGAPHAHVFGMSLGGMVAMQLALGHRDRVDRLVLGCTTPGGPDAPRPTAATRLALLRTRLGSSDARVRRTLSLMVSEASQGDPALRERWRRLLADEAAPLRGVLGQVAAALRHDVSGQLDRILAPTLVITGDDDVVIPPRASEVLLERLPDATSAVLPGARHDFTTDQPEAAARAIVAHVHGA